jgi:hypothetical protein
MKGSEFPDSIPKYSSRQLYFHKIQKKFKNISIRNICVGGKLSTYSESSSDKESKSSFRQIIMSSDNNFEALLEPEFSNDGTTRK